MAPAVVSVDALPRFIFPDEHRVLVASTPASFDDIPPVLRHKEDNVALTLDPALPEFSTQDLASGTLYVIESVLVFMSATGRGLKVEYPSITLHAISRSESGPSIYCQLDESSATENAAKDDDDVTEMREMIIVPKAAESLEPIFEALSLCASLHPDPADENDMDDDDDAVIDMEGAGPFETFTGADGEELSEVGRAALAHLESIIYDPFEKKDEEPKAEQTDGEAHDATAKEKPKDINGA